MNTKEWDQWFDDQYKLNERIERAIVGLAEGKDDAYQLALWSSVIERGAEAIRAYI